MITEAFTAAVLFLFIVQGTDIDGNNVHLQLQELRLGQRATSFSSLITCSDLSSFPSLLF
ncbi:hypothetical protein X798_05710 [Onchocerca flexuosa]|uniref:Uncharacterized protein n=1 Tax=Onchocerca flexuosa TaxID=387005 RepID=A0A238BRJ1_9BILA|nr:hypothetical protein X798_05710 [Onchocerca flexuosa]